MPKKSKKPGKKTNSEASALASKKKDLKEHKKNELIQLQDSLSSFFTPTSSRRSRNLAPAASENARDSDDSSTPSERELSESEETVKKEDKKRQAEDDDSEPRPSGSGNSTTLPPMRKLRNGGCPSMQYPPSVPGESEKFKKKKTVKKLTKSKKSTVKTPEDTSSDDEEEVIPRAGLQKYYYKGYWFADCPNGVIDPNGAGAQDLIQAFKSMEERNRDRPDFKEYSDVNSDTSYEQDRECPDRQQFRDINDYLNYCSKKLQKRTKIKDGLTRRQRREHRQFKREFAQLLAALEQGHRAVCDDEFGKYVNSDDSSGGDDDLPPDAAVVRGMPAFDMSLLKKSINKLKNPSCKYNYGNNFDGFSDEDDESSPPPDGHRVPEEGDDEMDQEEAGQPVAQEDLTEFRRRFDQLGFEAGGEIIYGWREMLPGKPLKPGAERNSSESSCTTPESTSPKPINSDIVSAAATTGVRPPEYRRYRSDMGRVMYRRLVRRACRNWVAKSNGDSERPKPLKVERQPSLPSVIPLSKPAPVATAPKARIRPPPDENMGEYLDSDDSDAEYLSYEDIMNRLEPAYRADLEDLFEETRRLTEERLKKVAEAKHPCPKYIHTNKYKIKTAYTGLFPEQFQTADDLYICDICLQGSLSRDQFLDHANTCQTTKPPGVEIYRDDEYNVSVFEVDALLNPSYCKMLCCWARCYIDHKQLWLDIEPFLFYVLTRREGNSRRNRFVGYFSKQKYQHSQCNLCCLLILPCYQGHGYGRFMVDFSFLLSKIEKIPGTPERPLSDAADLLYYKYYVETFYETVYRLYLDLTAKGEPVDGSDKVTLQWLEDKTAINKSDMLKVLVHEKIAEIMYDKKAKTPKGVRFHIDAHVMLDHIKKAKAKKSRMWIKPKLLQWAPSYNDPNELLHFPLVQTDFDVTNDVDMAEEEEEDEEPPPPSGPKKRGRKKKVVKPKVLLRRGMPVEEFEDKVSDPEMSFSMPFCNKDDVYMSLPLRRPKKPKKRPPMTGKRRRKNKKKTPAKPKSDEDEVSSGGPAFVVEQRTPSPVKTALVTPLKGAASSGESSRPSSSVVKRGKKKKSPSKKTCRSKTPERPFSPGSDSDDDKPGPSKGRPRNAQKQTPARRTAAASSPKKERKPQETPSRCNVMSMGSPKQPKSTPKGTKKHPGHSSEEETSVQHIRARIRGSSLDSSSSDDDHRHRHSRKRTTRQMKHDTDSAAELAAPVKRSSRQTESALDDDELQHEETADISFDPYTSAPYPMQVDDYPAAPSPSTHFDEAPPPQMELETPAFIQAPAATAFEMPKLMPTLQVASAMDEDDEDDDAPPMLSPMRECSDAPPPLFEGAHIRGQSADSDGPPLLQQSNVEPVHADMDSPLARMEQQTVPQQQPVAVDSVMENLINQQSRRSSTEQQQQQQQQQTYQMQQQQQQQQAPVMHQPGSSGMQAAVGSYSAASVSHPASAGSLHPGSGGNMLGSVQGCHTYPNSAGTGNGNVGTPLMTAGPMHPPSWTDMYLQQQSINLQQQPQITRPDLQSNFSMPLPQLAPVHPMEYPRPDLPKEQPKPKKPAKKKKKEPVQPKFNVPNPSAYDQSALGASFFNPYNVNMAAMAAAGGSANFYGYNQNMGNPPAYQNSMQWGNHAAAVNYNSFMNNPINQQKFYPPLQNYPMISGVPPAPPVVTVPNTIPTNWSRAPNPSNNPQLNQFYPYQYPYYP